MFSVTSRMRSVASPWRPIGWAPLAYCLMCWSSSLRAWVTPVAATPTCFRRPSSLVAPCDASTQPSTDLATSLPASISCSWHTGELMVGATTLISVWNDKIHSHTTGKFRFSSSYNTTVLISFQMVNRPYSCGGHFQLQTCTLQHISVTLSQHFSFPPWAWHKGKWRLREHGLCYSHCPALSSTVVFLRQTTHPCAGHQLRCGQGTLSGCSNDPVLLGWVLCLLGHVFSFEHQSCRSISHGLSQLHQHVLSTAITHSS